MSVQPHPEMKCQELVEVVTDYLERRLTEAEAAWTDEHLADCDACRAYLAQMRETITGLRGLAEADLDPERMERILAAMR